MADERAIADIAREAVEILRTFREGGMPSGEDDPRLDSLSNLILAGLQRLGFTAELASQMEKAGIEVPAEAWMKFVIMAAKRR